MEIGVFTFADVQPDPVTGMTTTPQRKLRDVVEQAELADQVGLSVFGVGEHHRDDFAAASPAVVLAAIASRTRSIRLTSAVTVLGSVDPVKLFEDFTALDLLSDGRAEITAGRGAFTESFPLFGLRLEDFEALFEEKLRLLLRLSEEETISWSGRFRPALREQSLHPRPVQQRLPVWVGVGGTPASAVRAGRLGLPLMIGIIGGQHRHFAPLVDLHRRAAIDAGHDPARLDVGVSSHTYVADTSQRAATEYFPYHSSYLQHVMRDRGRVVETEAAFEQARGLNGALLVGSPAQVVEKILHQHEVFGHSRFLAQIDVGALPHALAMRAIELLGTAVLPAVRQALGTAAGAADARTASTRLS